MVNSILRSVVVSIVLGMVVSCGPSQPSEQTQAKVFAPGDLNQDPIVQSAKQALAGNASSTDTITITVTNGSNYNLKDLLITTTPLFAVGQVPSAAVLDYIGGSHKADSNTLISKLGLVVGSTAFHMNDINKNDKVVVTIAMPATTLVSFIASVDAAGTGFVGRLNIPLSGGAPGLNSFDISGFSLDANKAVVAGNNTTGNVMPASTFSFLDGTDCSGTVLTGRTNMVSDEFTTQPNDSTWPSKAGWDGDFGGDWYTDGITARLWNPNFGNASPSAPIPTTTGFWKFIDICPGSVSTMSVQAQVATTFTDPKSDTTLVLYFFDRFGTFISVAVNQPMRGVNRRAFNVFDATVPAATRRIALAPMAYFNLNEQGDVFYDSIKLDYEAPGTVTTTPVASDDFSSYGASNYGPNQPTGWSEYGGDWYAMPTVNWATVGNPSWYGGTAGVDTGMVKSFSLSGFNIASGLLNAKLFAATTFTDPTSFARVRVQFNGAGTFYDSERLGAGYGALQVRRQPIPAGTTSVTVEINAYLGPAEKSSLYVDNFSLEIQKLN